MKNLSKTEFWLALLLSGAAQAQPSAPIATVANTGSDTVVVSTGATTIALPAGRSMPARSGDIVFVLARSTATVKYTDGCEISMTENQKLALSASDDSCTQRKAAVTIVPAQEISSLVTEDASANSTATAATAAPLAQSTAIGIGIGATALTAAIIATVASDDSSGGGSDGGDISPASF